jgi:hypothetical protein
MSITICSSEWMVSSPSGTDFADAWLPRIVMDRFATSAKDGGVDTAPDPVPFIDTEMSWTNDTGAQQKLYLGMHRAPRLIIASNPNLYVLDDAISWDIALSPNAPTPYATKSGIGATGRHTPFTVNEVTYGRLFRGWDDGISFTNIGTILAGQTIHIRYNALFSTPGSWRPPNQALQVVRAYWVRLQLWASPGATP